MWECKLKAINEKGLLSERVINMLLLPAASLSSLLESIETAKLRDLKTNFLIAVCRSKSQESLKEKRSGEGGRKKTEYIPS